ncbi:MAG: enoyl-CoA hydratase/isomerase family protein, partial [Actinobacteria bacterium]|nr:enoyl-CoA hydratase/isomerase family protein [Actinomycetota bacterium]
MTPERPQLKATTYDVSDGVAVITLSRPDRLNAWTARMEQEYRWLMADADADADVGVIVVTGAGRGFCAGADLGGLDNMAAAGAYEAAGDRDRGVPLTTPGAGVRADFEHPHTFPLGLSKPVIAAVNGPAAGVGFVLMCFADVRFAAAGAKFTTSFARLGLPAEHGVAWMLSRLIGPARAADLLFSSRVVLAEEAEDLGLVNRVLAPDELLPFTLDYARRMAAECAPSSLRTMKRQLYAD